MSWQLPHIGTTIAFAGPSGKSAPGCGGCWLQAKPANASNQAGNARNNDWIDIGFPHSSFTALCCWRRTALVHAKSSRDGTRSQRTRPGKNSVPDVSSNRLITATGHYYNNVPLNISIPTLK